MSNSAASPQEIWFFALQLNGEIQNPGAPPGWSVFVNRDRPIVSWGATEIGQLPPEHVDDGNIVPSPFQIKPGQTLGGFSFQSPDPPAGNRFFVEGFTKLPAVTEDVGELPRGGEELEDFTMPSVSGMTVSPSRVSPTPFPCGRRPAVDTFLVFTNIADGDTRPAPLAVIVKFGPNGETVDRSTFRATLNRIDVTGAFVPTAGGSGDLVAVFALGSSPLQVGRNVLLTTVVGTVPETTRTAPDVDRLTFFVQ
ncbi:MAG TPA: hypothetical protein VNN07_10775 [Candidatus Tectomicrobia bacterium]|nr:hypothetical protein [Candidatus Tectomicrobia bacterium]